MQDIALSAALHVPFTDGKLGFRFAVSSREHPFLITVSLFGGGGFFGLELGMDGVRLVEASFELATAGGALVPAPFPRSFVEQAVEPRFPVERVVRVPFDQTAWPAVPAFRLVCADPGAVDPAATGVPLPSWDAVTRSLTVALPKATTATVPVSSYVEVHDLPLLGVWAWIREALQELSEQVGGLSDGAAELEVLGLDAQVLVERARTGGHWMITPARTLTLVHAVQQPLGRPRLERQSARRDPDENAARLAGRLHVHGPSTLQIDLLATWSDRVNDPGSATGSRDSRCTTRSSNSGSRTRLSPA